MGKERKAVCNRRYQQLRFIGKLWKGMIFSGVIFGALGGISVSKMGLD
jgi:hypothetical protein